MLRLDQLRYLGSAQDRRAPRPDLALSRQAVSATELLEPPESGQDVLDTHIPGATMTVLYGPRDERGALVETLAGRRSPVRGAVVFEGRDVAYWRQAERGGHIALATDRECLPGRLTVRETVAAGRLAICAGAPSEADEIAVDAALDWVGLMHFRGRRYGDANPGEQIRIRFARAAVAIWEALAEQPRMLLIDEPELGRDLWSRDRMCALCCELAREGVGVVMALGEGDRAPHCASRILRVRQNRALYDGPAGRGPFRVDQVAGIGWTGVAS